jgi:hypothetical protein
MSVILDKGKADPVHTTKAHRVYRDAASLILNLGNK